MDNPISQWLRWLLGAALLGNAAAMLFAPQAWYLGAPGVVFTGPLNTHFVRDIGCAYAVAGAGLVWRACMPALGTGAAMAGAGFLGLHAFVHLGEALAGLCGWSSLWRNVPGVVLPALLAAGLALPPRGPVSSHVKRSFTMIDWFIRRRLAAFQKRYDYDTSYLRDLLGMSRKAMLRFGRASQLAKHREEVPKAAWYAAKIVAEQAEDCGPCVQLVVNMAREERVGDAVLRAVLSGDLGAMGSDAALGWRYARAVVAHSSDIAPLREEVLHRWGPRALASLALTITASRMFPMLKYALGHGQSCQRVSVGGEMLNAVAWRPDARAASPV